MTWWCWVDENSERCLLRHYYSLANYPTYTLLITVPIRPFCHILTRACIHNYRLFMNLSWCTHTPSATYIGCRDVWGEQALTYGLLWSCIYIYTYRKCSNYIPAMLCCSRGFCAASTYIPRRSDNVSALPTAHHPHSCKRSRALISLRDEISAKSPPPLNPPNTSVFNARSTLYSHKKWFAVVLNKNCCNL